MNDETQAVALTGLLVGMHFRPPAKEVLAALPAGTTLWLQREPDNPYDENAVKVLLPGFGPEGEHADLRAGLEATGKWGEEMFTDPLHLAFVDSTKTGMAKIFAEAMIEHAGDDASVMVKGNLTFALDGKSQVSMDLTEFLEPDLDADGLEDEEEDEDEE